MSEVVLCFSAGWCMGTPSEVALIMKIADRCGSRSGQRRVIFELGVIHAPELLLSQRSYLLFGGWEREGASEGKGEKKFWLRCVHFISWTNLWRPCMTRVLRMKNMALTGIFISNDHSRVRLRESKPIFSRLSACRSSVNLESLSHTESS